jgi:hypothetical protein
MVIVHPELCIDFKGHNARQEDINCLTGCDFASDTLQIQVLNQLNPKPIKYQKNTTVLATI